MTISKVASFRARVCRRRRVAGAPRNRRDGYTLIELLVAIVILSTGIVVVLEAFQTSLTALQMTRESLFGDMLIERRMAAITESLLSNPEQLAVRLNGRFEGDFKHYRWSQYPVGATPAVGGAADARLTSVSIAVWRRDTSDPRRLEMAYFMPEPES